MIRLQTPSRRTAHTLWLMASAVIALAVTHGVALPLLIAFFVDWLLGYGVLARLHG